MGNCFSDSNQTSRGGRPPGGGRPAGAKVQGKNPPSDAEMRAVFRQFDLDGDGYIDEGELRRVMSTMGQTPTTEEVQAMFRAADTNGDGRISFEEFCAISRANPLQLSLRAVFNELDLDGDGYLTSTELRDAFIRMGHDVDDEDIRRIIQGADINADSVINFEEFVTMMCQHKGL